MRPGRRLRTTVLVAVLVALGGCQPEESPDSAPQTTQKPLRKAFDPPRTFDAASAVEMPSEAIASKVNLAGSTAHPLPVVLHETTAYIAAPTQLLVVDTDTGEVTSQVTPRHEPLHSGDSGPFVGSNPAEAPALVEIEDKKLVVAPFVVRIPGTGTTQARRAMELVALDAADGTQVWNVDIPLSDRWSEDSSWSSPVTAAVAGVHGRIAVFNVFATDSYETYAVDLASKRALWTKDRFRAGAVAGETVVGTMTEDDGGTRFKAVGLSVAEGKRRWAAREVSSELTVHPGGPSFIVATGKNYGDGEYYYKLISAESGAVKESESAEVTFGLSCRYDGADVTVCWMSGLGTDWVGAFDSASGKWLWELPDKAAGRVPPRVTAAWHGAVYGTTADGHVVLDARTGKDREAEPGAAPYVVNGHVGIATDPTQAGVYAYKATG